MKQFSLDITIANEKSREEEDQKIHSYRKSIMYIHQKFGMKDFSLLCGYFF